MGIFIDSINFFNNWQPFPTGAQSLVGNVYNKISVVVQGYQHIAVDATLDNQIQFNPDGNVDATFIEMVNGGGDFAEFQAGDLIHILGSTSNDGSYTVVQKFDDSTIRVNASLTRELSLVGTYIRVYREYDSANYKYGLSENEDQNNYLSKIDSSVNHFYLESSALTIVASPIGFNKSWLTSLDVVNISLGSPNANTASPTYGRQSLFIQHNFYFNPFVPHVNSLGIPSYFDQDKCLKYEFDLLLKPTANSLDRFQEFSYSESLGNTGFFGERLNTGLTNYSVTSIGYQKVSDLSTVTAVQLTDTDKTRVTINVRNTVDSPFSGSTKAFACLHYVPQNATEYKSLPTYLDDNLYLDYAQNAHGTAAVNGFFTRHIENMTVTNSGTQNLLIIFDVDLPAGMVAELFSKENPEYIITVGVQNPAKDIFTGDPVTLVAAKAEFAINLGLEDLTDIVSDVIYQHYDEYDNLAHPILQDTIFFKEDEFGVKRRLRIDVTESVYKKPILKSVTAGARLRRVSDGFTTDLQSFTYDASLDPIVNELAFIDASVDTSYKVDAGDKLKQFKIKRNLPLDATYQWFYDLEIPIMVRWEFWEQNNLIPDELFDNTLPLNNKNNNWDGKDAAGYEVTVFTRCIIELNGVNYASENDQVISILNYDEGIEWDPFTFVITDLDNNVITSILGYENVKVRAFTSYIGGGTQPLGEEVELVLRIEPTQNGGHYVSRRYSTALTTQDTWFEESNLTFIDRAAKVVNFVGNVYAIEAIITAADLPDFNSFDLTARIYNLLSSVPVGAKIMESGAIKLMESGAIKIMD